MENKKVGEENNLDVTPIETPRMVKNGDIYYNCNECSSLIEILSISEENNIIEFKCLNRQNNHNKKSLPIKKYLENMKKYNNKDSNGEICINHGNNKYISYCFDCNKHLCKKCLKGRAHINHVKNNIIEIEPDEKDLTIIKEVISYYEKK